MIDVRLTAFGSRTRIAASVYGTIVVLAVLTAGAIAYDHELWKLGAIVSAEVLVLWVAHFYAHVLGDSITLGRRLTRPELLHIGSRELAIPLAAVLPLAAIALGAAEVVADATAVWLAFGLGIATLALQGVRYARIERFGLGGTIVSVGLNVALGLTIVALKVIVSH